jgi:hypothetical protein
MKKAFACALPVLSLLFLAPAAPAREVTRAALQKQDIVLLQRVEDTARDVLATAERLSTFNRVPTEYSRECHVVQLESLKEGINSMTRDLDRLAITRNGLDDADRKAVNRVLIAAVNLAQTPNAAILKAGAIDASPALSADYRRLMEDCARDADTLVKALSAGIVELK